MKALAAKSPSNDTSTKSAGVKQRHTPGPKSVPVFTGTNTIIQTKSICPCDGGCPKCTGMIQPKLTIGQPNDKYEQEADRVADQIMRMPEPGGSLVQRKAGCSACMDEEEEVIQPKPIADQITPLVQRQAESEIEEEEEEPVQLKSSTDKSPPMTAGLQSQIQSMKGGGQPLSKSVRNYFEPRFGHDFSRVRIHTGAKAGESARQINALAYTVGHDIVVGTGQFAPETMAGRRLLAHELTLAVQQSRVVPAVTIQRHPPGDFQYPFPHPQFPGTTPVEPQWETTCLFDPIRFIQALKGNRGAIRHVLDCCAKGIPIAGRMIGTVRQNVKTLRK